MNERDQQRTLSISGTPSESVTITLALSSPTPSRGSNVTRLIHETLEFDDSSDTFGVRVSVPRNDVRDFGEFSVSMSASRGSGGESLVSLGSPLVVTWVDDESPIFVAVSDVSVSEDVASGLTGLEVFLSESDGTAIPLGGRTNYGDVVVTWTATADSATRGVGEDYEGTTGTATISAGALSSAIPSSSLRVLSDDVYEGDESFDVVISFADDATTSGVSLSSSASASVTIEDGELKPTASVTPSTLSLVEGGAAETATVTLSGAASVSSEFELTSSLPSVIASSDVAVSAGDLTADVSLSALDDDSYLGERAVTMTLSPKSGNESATVDSSAGSIAVTVSDEDSDKAILSVSAGASSVSEDDVTVSFVLSLDRALKTGESATVSYGLSGTASSGSDYTSLGSSPVSFGVGENEKTISVTLVDDNVAEGDETLVFEASSVSGSAAFAGSATSATATTTILANDSALTLSSVSANGGGAIRVVVSESLLSGEKFGYSCAPSCEETRYVSSSPFDVTGLSGGVSYVVSVWRASASDDSRLNSVSSSSSVTTADAIVASLGSDVSVTETDAEVTSSFEISLSRAPSAGNSVRVAYQEGSAG